MKLVKPKVEILDKLDGNAILNRIEQVARTCYKSEAKFDGEVNPNKLDIISLSAPKFVKRLIDSKHEAMLEFFDVTVRFTTSIGITRELIRHRLASFANESTRYCDYSKDKFNNEITFIIPSHLDIPEGGYTYWHGDWVDMGKMKIELPADSKDTISTWLFDLKHAEISYMILKNKGWKAEQAREVLPMSTKSELCMKCNLREWRHFFKLRCSTAAHPDIRVLALDLLKQMHEQIPVIFDDLYEEFYDSERSEHNKDDQGEKDN